MYCIGAKLGHGVHGDVWSLVNYPDRVIKMSWAPLTDTHSLFAPHPWLFSAIKSTYHYLLAHHFSSLAHIYDFQTLHHSPNSNRQHYSVILERLQPLTHDESKVMKSVCMDYNGNIEKGKCLQHIRDLKRWLSFDHEKMSDFYVAVNELPVVHKDFHRRNIMKDNQGNFKLIDFELLNIKENGQ